MKNTYVLYTREMAFAYADVKKSQTRRIMKPQPINLPTGAYCDPYNHHYDRFTFWTPDNKMINNQIGNVKGSCHWNCPYGQPGDQLTFVTTWKTLAIFDDYKPTELPMTAPFWSYFDDAMPKDGKLRPGRFMPKWMRDQMPKTILKNVRVERLHAITDEDAIQEGVDRTNSSIYGFPTLRFKKLWDKINGKTYPWTSNPWVFVLEWEKK